MPACTQKECPFPKTGQCLEGHKNALQCPHIVADAVSEGPGAPGVKTTEPTLDGLFVDATTFHTGEKLNVKEATRVLEEFGGSVVLCAGAADCGKTTFLAKIGELFCHGQFTDWRFGGSITLCAFERASWRATILSGAVKPTTPRTSRIENDTFLQVLAKPAKSIGLKNILISDLAGETFPHFISSQASCDELAALQRADHVALFLNCMALSDSALRHAEFDNAMEFLNMVVKSKSNCATTHLQIIFSRWDAIEASTKRAADEKYCDTLQARAASMFSEHFRSLSFFRTSARPDNGYDTTDGEIQKIFTFWVGQNAPKIPFVVPASTTTARLFNSLRLS